MDFDKMKVGDILKHRSRNNFYGILLKGDKVLLHDGRLWDYYHSNLYDNWIKCG